MGTIIDLLKDIPLSAVLKEKITTMEYENASLKTEIAILKDEKRELEAQNKRLKDEIDRLTHTFNLEEEEIKILAHVGKSNESFDIAGIAYAVELNSVKAKYFVEELRNKEFVSPAASRRGQPARYRLAQKGREYIIKNNLI